MKNMSWLSHLSTSRLMLSCNFYHSLTPRWSTTLTLYQTWLPLRDAARLWQDLVTYSSLLCRRAWLGICANPVSASQELGLDVCAARAWLFRLWACLWLVKSLASVSKACDSSIGFCSCFLTLCVWSCFLLLLHVLYVFVGTWTV